jgi:hypothetical protein
MTATAAIGTDVRVLSKRQALFIGYFFCVLVDLTVLNLFDEYFARVEIDSFTTSLLAAALLQLLLKLTIALEHRVADYFKKQIGKSAKAKRVLATWLILFGSKFMILGAINIVFGDKVVFGGVIPFIIVVLAVMAAELAINQIYVMLGKGQN